MIEAPGEAEAQCAVLAKAGAVYATGTEDMDALTFATPYLLKKLTFSAGQQQPIQQVNHAKILEGLELTNDEFIDLCILCGCDYCDKIPGIGPKTALKLLRKYHCIEEVRPSQVFSLFHTSQFLPLSDIDCEKHRPQEASVASWL